MRRDQLAAVTDGASKQTYLASENATQYNWDLAFLTPSKFCDKYQITRVGYREITRQ
jgi:hypothetical protein